MLRGLLGLVACLGVVACGSDEAAPAPTPSPLPRNLRGDVTDPVGDATGFAGVAVPRDLVSSSIEITSGNLALLNVRFAPGTFSAASTLTQFDFDVD